MKNIPLMGWGMQVAMFIFLNRNKEQDLKKIADMLRHITTRIDPQANVLIFPEGTDLSLNTLAKSHQFSKENNLPAFEYVLHPKSAGFVACCEALQGKNRVLHDVTIAYEDIRGNAFIPSDKCTYRGIFPSTVHMYVRRFKMSDLPNSSAGTSNSIDRTDTISQWLKSTFAAKEKLLSEFYSSETNKAEKVVFATKYTRSSAQVHMSVWWTAIVSVVVLTVGGIWVLYSFTWFRWVVLIECLLFLFSPLFDGMDTAELYVNRHGA